MPGGRGGQKYVMVYQGMTDEYTSSMSLTQKQVPYRHGNQRSNDVKCTCGTG